MRIAIVALVALACTAAAAEEAAIPREGTSTNIAMGSNSLKVIALGKERSLVSWEFLGARVTEDGKGVMPAASVRCVGSVLVVNGEYSGFQNACVFTGADGDQIFATETATGRIGAPTTGTGTIVGGTGKLAGITGSYEFKRTGLKPAAEGTGQFVTRSITRYKLP